MTAFKMTDERPKPVRPKPQSGKAAREKRLAEALRANLRRRKAAPEKPDAP